MDHIKSLGWNMIRLGVVWAGAQPRDEDALDPTFLELLHAVLNLTDAPATLAAAGGWRVSCRHSSASPTQSRQAAREAREWDACHV